MNVKFNEPSSSLNTKEVSSLEIAVSNSHICTYIRIRIRVYIYIYILTLYFLSVYIYILTPYFLSVFFDGPMIVNKSPWPQVESHMS